MAGRNVVILPGRLLFSAGDASDGMYLIRKGRLSIFIESEGRQTVLAEVTKGTMIGEMALLDQKPRSASVKALERTELTHIGQKEFDQLMRQVPKWFVGVMNTLSSRIRDANERITTLEAKTSKAVEKVLHLQKILHVVDLLWQRDGAKVGKDWQLEVTPIIETLTEKFLEKPDVVRSFLAESVKSQLFDQAKDAYNNDVLVVKTRANLTRFLSFLDSYLADGVNTALTETELDILRALAAIGADSAYPSFQAPMKDAELAGKKLKLSSVGTWSDHISRLRKIHSDIKVSQDGQGKIIFSANAKTIPDILQFHILIRALSETLA